jgi:hypothetical protein
MEKQLFQDTVQIFWNTGATVLEVKTHDEWGDHTRRLRLFLSTSKTLCYKDKGRKSYGYPIGDMGRGYEIVSVRNVTPKVKTGDEITRYIENVRKFQKAFMDKAHVNVWNEITSNYAKLDIADFEKYLRENAKENPSHYDCYTLYCEYAKTHDLQHLIYENRFKTVTIKSFNPSKRAYKTGYGHYAYQAAVDNIQRHLDNRENFEYDWRAGYDVHVSGKQCEDGQYRAWMALEFKDCGNGHYYLLINSNTAVFTEDD